MGNKTVVITGASSGIGEACARIFALKGYHVVIAARNTSRLEKVKTDCLQLGAASCLVATCDVSKEQDCQNLINETVLQLGTIHVLINNAGISMRALFSELNLEVVKQVMNTNFWGTVYCTKYAIPYLLREKGSVIAVSSVAGIKGLPGRTGYSASKFAINGFMEALRIENLKTGLHVGVICPGYTASNIRKTALNREAIEQGESPFEEDKLMSAEAVAASIYQMVVQRKAERVLSIQGKVIGLLQKFFPRWLDKLVFSTVSKEKDSPF